MGLPRVGRGPSGPTRVDSRLVTIPQDRLRNFSIIAHIDHGKSTLADRLLELTHTIDARQMTSQVLDSMDLEREKGITIKARAVRLEYTAKDGLGYGLNLIDTPGPRRLQLRGQPQPPGVRGRDPRRRCGPGHRGPDARQRPPRARARASTIIPVLNKIDLPSAQPEVVMDELENVLAIPREEVILVSAKEGTGVAGDPRGDRRADPAAEGRPGDAAPGASSSTRHYDPYKGVVVYVRLAAGHAPRRTTRSG